MLEALYQAGIWLVYHTDQFAHAVVALKEARNVKFTDFVKPGETLTVSGTLASTGSTAVSARLVLERFNWADRLPNKAAVDGLMRRDMRNEFYKLLPQELRLALGA